MDLAPFPSLGERGGSTSTGPSDLMTGLEAAPIVLEEMALAVRAEGGMRVCGAGRSCGVERWEGGSVVGFVAVAAA